VPNECRRDLLGFLGSFAGGENHLGDAPPEVAVVVDAREAHVLDGPAAQLDQGIRNAARARGDRLEDLFELLRLHTSLPDPARRPIARLLVDSDPVDYTMLGTEREGNGWDCQPRGGNGQARA
jgi:hypothetical protein